MVFFKIAFGSLLKRKKRMISIGVLVIFGTVLIMFGQEFARSARSTARRAIVENLTGDLVLYSSDSKEKPSALSWSSPLVNIKNIGGIREFLRDRPEVDSFTAYAQNIAIISVQTDQQREIPFIFSAVEPRSFIDVFDNFDLKEGTFFDAGASPEAGKGIVVSDFQNKKYKEVYDVSLRVGDTVTLLGVTPGGAVNAIKTTVRGIYTARTFGNIYDYVNFMDMESYSSLYNFTGVDSTSLPPEIRKGLAAASEDEIFGLGAGPGLPEIDVSTLKSTELSGYSLVSVRLKKGAALEEFQKTAEEAGRSLGFLVERWDEASGGFARVSSFLGVFVYGASGLVFLIVALIIMNTLIINILERTPEIGTIRAIGGGKGFIRLVFLTETFILTVAAGVVGVGVSSALIGIFGGRGISLPPVIARFLIGGGKLFLSYEPVLVLQALLVIVLISAAATLYPLRVATRVTPLKAMAETMQ
jgi:ABC-type lipoprotein release transport system permease subunit